MSAPRVNEAAERLRALGPPTDHCASDCCNAYPRLHAHGDHDEWNELLAALAAERTAALDVEALAEAMDRHYRDCIYDQCSSGCAKKIAAEYARLAVQDRSGEPKP